MIQDTVDNILVFEQEWDQQIRALRSKNARDPRISRMQATPENPDIFGSLALYFFFNITLEQFEYPSR